MRGIGKLALALMAALGLGGSAALADGMGLQPDGSFVVGPEASKVIGQYLSKVTGRYGALAVADDGSTAAYYICQSRLWKNCDDYSLEDSFVSIPSGDLAAKLAERRCRGVTGSGCTVLFINDKWRRQFTLSQ